MRSAMHVAMRWLTRVALLSVVCAIWPEVIHPETRHRDTALLSSAEQAPIVDLVMGGSGYPIPPSGFIDAAHELYFEPTGRGGTAQGVITPELYTDPTRSMQAGSDALVQKITQVLEEDPNTTFNIFGYSQSAALITLAMEDLKQLGISDDQLHFIMVGDPSTPNGGLINMLDVSPFREMMYFVGQDEVGLKTPDDLYPADVYGLEYDGFVDFPKYPLNLISTANALVGLAFEHLAYLGLTPEQIDSAVSLPVDGDSLVTYHMIPSELLPLLAPLLFIPTFGRPLYDLLEPTVRILANLGYGNIEHGWSDDPVNVAQVVDVTRLLPADIDMAELSTALSKAWDAGVDAFAYDMANLQPAVPGLANDLLRPLVQFGQVLGALAPADSAPSLAAFLTNNIVAQRDDEEYFLEHYSTLEIPNWVSYLFGSPYGYMMLTDTPFPDFDLS